MLQDDITQAEGFQVALRSFAAWCLAAANCPLRGGSGALGHGAAARSVDAVVARLQGVIVRLIPCR